MRILIIGKDSFIGKNFIKYSSFRDLDAISLRTTKPEDIDYSDYNAILHLAAIVHQKKEIPLDEYIKINSELPYEIAQLAKKKGIKHFIFISTISVYGNFDPDKEILNEFSECNPVNNYGKSKLDAENKLTKLTDSNFSVTILRTPMVYGENVKANMLKLIKLVDKFSILPFANAYNKRSYIAVENLIKYIDTIIEKKVNGTLLASDPRPLSTEELVRLIAKYLNKKLFLFKVPKFIMKLGMVIKPQIFDKIYGSYLVENQFTMNKLEIANIIEPEEEFKRMIDWYINNKK